MSYNSNSSDHQLAYKRDDVSQKAIRVAKDFSAGWVGGIAQVLVGQPFDTIKVLLQTQSSTGGPSYRGPVHCALKTIKKDGISGLYRVPFEL